VSSTSHLSGPNVVPSRQPARFKFNVWSAIAGSLSFCLIGHAAFAVESPRAVPGRLLVKPRAGISESDFSARIAVHAGFARRLSRHSNVRIVNLANERTASALRALRADPEIEFAEPDYLASASFVPSGPLIGSEWHLGKIQAQPAWDISTGSSNVIVAVLDSGVNAAHPDLLGKILPGYDFVWNDTNADDDFGHGTAVAGTIVAAGNNGIGVAGVAYGCQVLPVKVMDASGSASHSTIAQGIEYAVAHGARVINLSMGGDMPSSTLQEAINFAWSNNVVVVASAGNTGGTAPQYPAACDHVIAVGASDQNDSRAWFSTYGSFVSLTAPGQDIWTTQRDLSNPYAAWSGTSFSSPLVAGVAGLICAINPGLSNSEVVQVLEQTADDVGAAGPDSVFGYGRLNAYRALAAAYPGTLPTQNVETNSAPPDTVETTDATPSPLTLSTLGLGSVSGLRNGALLEVGKTYSVRASPLSGQVFAGWQGVSSQSPLLTFVMQPNLTLVATFVPSPFPAVKGNYNGLINNQTAVMPENSGAFAVTVTASGAFSGRVMLAGTRHGFHGRFDPNGDAVVAISRGTLSLLHAHLHLDLASPTDKVSGTLSDGNWTSAMAGDRNVFSSQFRPAQQAGNRSLTLSRSDETEAANGLSKIAVNGVTRVRGTLVDGRPFATASALSKSGDCPFYLSLNHGTEVVIGWLNFPIGQGPSANGTVLWVKSGTNSFAATLQAASAPGQ
jgi:hypothetical protein